MIRSVLHKVNVFTCRLYLKFISRLFTLKSCESTENEKIIVSMTSWSKRINNVPAVIESILKNTLQPDKIVLNLSIQEFPNKEQNLPEELLCYIKKGIVEIIWLERNDKAFKKFIPTMKKYPNDAIIAIDDDFIYPPHFIETFITKHKQYPNTPLSGNIEKVFGAQAHCGCASLVKANYFGNTIEKLLDDTILNLRLDDVFYTYCMITAGNKYKYVGTMFFLNMEPNNPICGLSENVSRNVYLKMSNYLIKKIRNEYHINVEWPNEPVFINPISKTGKFWK